MKDDELRAIRDAIDADRPIPEPEDPALYPVYESLELLKQRYESRIRELEQAASERDAFYSDMQQMRSEHHMAEEIQRSLLPGDADGFRESHHADLYADMDTAWEIGGDFYDYFPLDEEHLFFCIGDVSGKGVSAALFCAIVKTAVAMSMQVGTDPAQVCTEVSARLYQTQRGKSRMFATLWAGVLEKTSGIVTYVNAGHELPLLVRKKGEIIAAGERTGFPVASWYDRNHPEKNTYTSGTLAMEAGDALVLFTDGLTDSENEEGQRFGAQRIRESLADFPVREQDARETVSYLERRIGAFADHGIRDDDITLLVLRFLGDLPAQTPD